MAFLKGLFTRFQKQCETTEGHPDEQLKTHYYKATYNQMFQNVEKLFMNDPNYRVTSVSKDHGEIALESVKGIQTFIIVTMISIKPLETAVDFNISTERFLLTGSYIPLKRQIVSLYEKIGKIQSFIGTGKNAQR
jgi:hypothetical protein